MEGKTVFAVLRELAGREQGTGYAPLLVEGCSSEEVLEMLRYLKSKRFIDSREVKGLGSVPEIEVSGLTIEGRSFLRVLMRARSHEPTP
jgi:hypothetical protein